MTTALAGKTIIVKIGGNSLSEDPQFQGAMVQQLTQLQQAGARLVLIHGGGPQIDAALRLAGITPAKGSDGRRLTDAATMAVVAQTMRGMSDSLVTALQAAGAKTQTPSVSPVWAEPLQQDRTGRPAQVEARMLQDMLAAGVMPVLNSVGRGADDGDYNVNADDYALAVAVALRAERLLLVTNVMGVWGADKRPLPRLTPTLAAELITQGVIAGGMIPKVESALAALAGGVGGIAIIDGHRPAALITALTMPEHVGTLLCAA